ncbi:hypothetical protein AN1V17_45320 [Vallitalea sediminicola]
MATKVLTSLCSKVFILIFNPMVTVDIRIKKLPNCFNSCIKSIETDAMAYVVEMI